VRVHPPASRIWIDGKEIENPSHRIVIHGEDHQLLIRYRDELGHSVDQSKQLRIKAGEKLRLYLDMTQN